ncbi:hypothetical protein GYMLUDRAFT_247384 [Collybiopsis luxurians FD-317 M1]|uniref:Unplaced genomic scaffold GYMLUscaffold_46, whole genome shotgun sequence n=1 Tax=Collybiopsis luxurians FD-317 M1 TaxID=944289 RepID=A0A0D0B168_9AGAR|nr:hypothetical protein GYMLUDRAFT_247384 [Collybiopsis luxurians FD-317 M1]
MTATTSALGFPCPTTSSSQILVDDSDVARIDYSNGWEISGNPNFECNGTTHKSTHQAGTLTTATFSFEGPSVQVFGTVGINGDPTSSYQLDDLPPFLFNFNASTLATRESINYRVQFYASPQLEPGNHTLVISSLGEGAQQMFLDYILYNPITSAQTRSINLPSSTFSETSPTVTPQCTSIISARALAGSIAGSTALGLILGIILLFFQRRKKSDSHYTTTSNSAVNTPVSASPTSSATRNSAAHLTVPHIQEIMHNTDVEIRSQRPPTYVTFQSSQS